MKKVWAKDTCKSLRSLGIYSICAGSWILTDSKIFLLIAQKTGMIEQIPFLCFFFLPVALLEFTKKIMPQKEQMLFILQNLFLMMECIYRTGCSGYDSDRGRASVNGGCDHPDPLRWIYGTETEER